MGLNQQALLAQGFGPVDIQSAHTHIAAQSGVAAALNQNQAPSGGSSQGGNVSSAVQAVTTNIENAVVKHLSGLKIDVYDKYKLWFLMLVGAIILFVLLWRPWADKDILSKVPTVPVASQVVSPAPVTLADVDNARLKAELAASKQLIDCLSQTGPCAVKK